MNRLQDIYLQNDQITTSEHFNVYYCTKIPSCNVQSAISLKALDSFFMRQCLFFRPSKVLYFHSYYKYVIKKVFLARMIHGPTCPSSTVLSELMSVKFLLIFAGMCSWASKVVPSLKTKSLFPMSVP